MFSSFSSFRNRILVIASVKDLDCSAALDHHYGAVNTDTFSWEEFQISTTSTATSHYASISFFGSAIEFDGVAHESVMRKFHSLLHPGGTVNFHFALPKESVDSFIYTFSKACIYAGFVDPHVARDKENAQLKRAIQLVAQKPRWIEGSAATITPDGLIDDSTLLDENEVYVPMGKNKSDCSSKPRACDNCTCGRKELEVDLGAEEAKQRLESTQIRSSCGSCYLGDAFRCSGCPYKGLPAFKPGEKIQLDIDQSDLLLLNETSGEGVSSDSPSAAGVLKLQV